MTYLPCPPGVQPSDADVSVTMSRATLNAVLTGETTLQQAAGAGLVTLEGAVMKLAELFGLFDTFGEAFNIVTP